VSVARGVSRGWPGLVLVLLSLGLPGLSFAATTTVAQQKPAGRGTGSPTTTVATVPATPPPAGAGSTSPFSIGLPQPQAPTPTLTTPTVTTPVSSTSTGGFGTLDALLIAAGVAIVIGGISVYVVRDARASARALGHSGTEEDLRRRAGSGSKAPPKPRKLSAQERRRRKRGRAPRRR
jgi:hypothetical protein